MKSNFIIGTANLKSKYGLKKNFLSKYDFRKILTFLISKKKKFL